MRLIDADALLQRAVPHGWSTPLWVSDIAIEDAPTIDAVPVVRCKDCRWGREVCGNIECSVDRNLPPEYHGYEWFCPNGERRENEGN